MNRRIVRSVAAVTATVCMAACGGGDRLPGEADLPPEASLAYPGSIEIERSFDEGETGTYLEGGSAYRPPNLRVRYRVEQATSEEILEWFETNTQERGWTLKEPKTAPFETGATRYEGDLKLQIMVTTGPDPVGEYTVKVTLSYVE